MTEPLVFSWRISVVANQTTVYTTDFQIFNTSGIELNKMYRQFNNIQLLLGTNVYCTINKYEYKNI